MKEGNLFNYPLLSYKSVAQFSNNITFSYYYYKLMLIARALFEWEGLPNNMESRWIEKYLFTDGQCIFFKDPVLGYMVAGVAQNGGVNCYDDPTTVMPIAPNYVYSGTSPLMCGEDCYLIRNNDLRIPEFSVVRYYAFKLANIERAIDVNIEAQKTPTIVRCTDKQRLSLKQAINQRRDNEPVMYVDESLDLDAITTLDLKPPMVFKDLQVHKHMVINEFFTDIGVNNANMDKRERMVANEVEANNEQVKASEDVLLRNRQEACKNINRIFGLNISVKRRELDKIPEYEDIIKEEEA